MQTTLKSRTADTSGLVAMNQLEQSGTQTCDTAVARPHWKPIHKDRGKTWTGRIASGLAVAFLFFDAIPKILQLSWVVKASTQMGFPAAAIQPKARSGGRSSRSRRVPISDRTRSGRFSVVKAEQTAEPLASSNPAEAIRVLENSINQGIL
jgi:hypothetical protein